MVRLLVAWKWAREVQPSSYSIKLSSYFIPSRGGVVDEPVADLLAPRRWAREVNTGNALWTMLELYKKLKTKDFWHILIS